MLEPDLLQEHNAFVIGERLYLRPLEPECDAHLYASWLNDPAIRRYFASYPISAARAQERLALLYKEGRHILLGVVLRADHRLIGLVGLNHINDLHQNAEFYIIIGDRSLWGQGYGTEATRLMLHYGFTELNLHRIQSEDAEEDVGGWRADEKAGFTYEGTMREAVWRTGQFRHVRLYSILQSEYLARLQVQEE